MSYVESPTKSFPNNAALADFLRVVVTAGYLAAADAGTPELGVLEKQTFSTDAVGTVRLRSAQGTVPMVASGAITAFAKVFAAAGGKIAATGTVIVGIALQAAGADGDIIEVVRYEESDPTLSIGASTAAAGSTTSDAGALPAGTSRIYPTTAADDTKGVVINAADKVTGRMLFIGNGVADKILKVYPPSGGTINGASADAAFSSASGKGVVIACLSSGSNTWLAW